MIGVKRIKRWSMRVLHALVLGAALSAPASFVDAQAPSGAPRKIYTKNPVFDLPVQMDEPTRATLNAVRLYVKTPTGAWVMHEEAPASVTRFTYRVPQDGEFWFNLQTIERNGRASPTDIAQAPVAQRVVVDTQAPVIQGTVSATPEGDFLLRCNMQEANPDAASWKAFARTEAGEMMLDLMPGQPGVFRLRGRDPVASPVRVTCSDLSGNTASKDFDVRGMVAAIAPPRVAQLPVAPPPVAAPSVTQLPVAQLPPVTQLPPVMNQSSGDATNTTSARIDPKQLPGTPPPRFEVPPRIESFAPPATNPPGIAPGHSPQILTQNPPMVTPPPASEPAPKTPPASIPVDPSKVGAIPRQLINTTQASIDYRVDQVGPSGVGRVEIFLSPDQGQSWQRHREHAARRSPAEIDLPGEGLFGVRIAITNGNGFGGSAPVRGDQPHCWIEVDTTAPFLQLRPVEILPQSSSIEIRWTATDKNLGTEPVNLFFRTRPDAPWQTVARNVKNDGVHRWNFPRDSGSQFFFKVEVADLAGNIARAESPAPVVLDMTEPRASVIGVTGIGVRATPPLGN
jgi:hypothetical protein